MWTFLFLSRQSITRRRLRAGWIFISTPQASCPTSNPLIPTSSGVTIPSRNPLLCFGRRDHETTPWKISPLPHPLESITFAVDDNSHGVTTNKKPLNNWATKVGNAVANLYD
ncbi:Uncharacterized protein Rs2_24940 [Raphanus sativus]|nr:Uncharacterized protein Rs2_24940 [Raphanus sativus]